MRNILTIKTYGWLLETLKDKGPITLKDINKLWMADRISEGKEIARRTFIRHKYEIEELLGISIACDSQFRYYIENQNLPTSDNYLNWMLESITTNEAIVYNKKKVLKRIVVEKMPSVAQYLKPILKSIESSVMIDITYQINENSETECHRVKPYYLKLCCQRWHLLGIKEDGSFMTFALDKIKDLKKTKVGFVFDESLNAEDF